MKLGDGLLRGASASFVMRIVGMGLSWLVVMMLTRLLGAKGYGTYAFLLSAATVLSLPANFGASMLLVREVGAAQATENWGRMRGAAMWALRYSLLMSLPIVAAAILTLIFLPHLVCLLALLPLERLSGGTRPLRWRQRAGGGAAGELAAVSGDGGVDAGGQPRQRRRQQQRTR